MSPPADSSNLVNFPSHIYNMISLFHSEACSSNENVCYVIKGKGAKSENKNLIMTECPGVFGLFFVPIILFPIT